MLEAVTPPAEYGFTEPTEAVTYYEAALRGIQASILFTASEAGKALVREHYDATHDKLTGLLNFAGFEELVHILGTEIEGVGILYLDATNFKAVNDRINHAKGNTILCEIASVIRSDDYAARIGGDEFLVLLMPTGDQQHGSGNRTTSLSMSSRLRQARSRIEADMEALLRRHPYAASLGLQLAVGATLGKVGHSIDEMKAEAEAEMKLHKAEQHRQLGQYRGS